MSYIENLQSILDNDSAVQAAVDSWILSSVTYYMIFRGTALPKDQLTDSGLLEINTTHKTINHYRTTPQSGAKPVVLVNHSLSCRADVETDAIAIQTAAFDALNRVKSNDGESFYVCTKLSVLPPSDDTDNYNAPLEVTVRST